MVVGIGFLAVMTAAITSTCVEVARRRIQGSESESLDAKLDEIGVRLTAIERRLAESGAQGRDVGGQSSGASP